MNTPDIKAIRRWSDDSVQAACIKNDLYTRGTYPAPVAHEPLLSAVRRRSLALLRVQPRRGEDPRHRGRSP